VIIVVAVGVALIIGLALTWYFLRKPKAATEVGGCAARCSDPRALGGSVSTVGQHNSNNVCDLPSGKLT